MIRRSTFEADAIQSSVSARTERDYFTMQTALSGTASRAGPPFDLCFAVLGGEFVKDGLVRCRILRKATTRTFYNYQVSGIVGCFLKLYGSIDIDRLLKATSSASESYAKSARKAAEKLNDLATHGVILSDEVGLGKTVQGLAVACLHAYLSDTTDGDGNPTYLPMLLVVPPTLVNQWLAELRAYWPGFRVVVSYEDHDFKDIMKLTTIPHTAMKEYPDLDALPESLRYIFDRSCPQAGNVLIVTSYETHKGRTAEKKTKLIPGVPYKRPRKNADGTPKWKKKPRRETYYVTKHIGTYSLLICDEAQKVKNFATGIWTVLHLQSFRKTVLITATPMYNSAKVSLKPPLESTSPLGDSL